MEIGRISELLMRMDDETWLRHSNPWSGWSRITVLPLLCLAIWSRDWLGWHTIWPVLAVLIWTWVNPRLFGPPKTQSAWMTKGVLGERIWLARATNPIPRHHAKMASILNFAAGLSVVVMGLGLWQLDFGLTFAGLLGAMGSKLWFLDRMVWLWSGTDGHHA